MPLLNLYMAIAVGGAIGACARYAAAAWVARLLPGSFAWGTLLVNVAGSLLIGVLFVLITEKAVLPEAAKPFLVTGILGGFTTFSAFSLETVGHVLEGQYLAALVYTLLSLLLCVSACFAGIWFTRLF